MSDRPARCYRILSAQAATFLGLLFHLFSCSDPAGPASPTGYFNAEKYFAAEAVRLAEVSKVRKSVTWNGKTEESTVEMKDWKKELEPFSQCSIDKPALRNSYAVDSSSIQGVLHITYTALEPALPVRQMEIQRAAERLLRIEIITGDTNLVYALRRTLTYQEDSGYSIRGWQSMEMTNPSEYSIGVTWR